MSQEINDTSSVRGGGKIQEGSAAHSMSQEIDASMSQEIISHSMLGVGTKHSAVGQATTPLKFQPIAPNLKYLQLRIAVPNHDGDGDDEAVR